MKLGKQRAIKLLLNRRYEEKKFSTDRNILKDGDNQTAFEPACVFYEKKPRWKFWRGSKDIVLFVEGAVNALRFGKTTKNMNPFWTQKEEKTLVRREMKKGLASHKPLTWTQFIILMIPIVVILLCELRGLFYRGF